MHAIRNMSDSPITSKLIKPDYLVEVNLPSGQIRKITASAGNPAHRDFWGGLYHELASEHDVEELTAIFRRLAFKATIDALCWIGDRPALVRFSSGMPGDRQKTPIAVASCSIVFLSNDEACLLFDHDKKILTLPSCWEWEPWESAADEMLAAPEMEWLAY